MRPLPPASAPFPVLTTERLVLRQITDDDTEALFTLLADPEVTRYLNLDVDVLTTPAQAQALITRVCDRFRWDEAIRWAITRHGQPRLIGTCGYTELVLPGARGQIGYDLQRAAWGQGIMTEALRAILHYGFTELGCYRIEAGVMLGNTASMQTLHRIGFQEEGTLRAYGYWKGWFWDLRFFSLLRSEWRALPTREETR